MARQEAGMVQRDTDRTLSTGHAPDRTGLPGRVLAYCHDGVGIGHLRRTLTICEEIAGTNDEVSACT